MNGIEFAISFVSFFMITFGLLVYMALGAANKLPNYKVLDFYESLFALGAVSAFKVIIIYLKNSRMF